MSRGRLIGLCGALRKGSSNRKLMNAAAQSFDPAEFIEANLQLPLYDGDVEDSQGIPDAVIRLRDQIAAADAVIISTPEYNKALSGVLKNALDWISRTDSNPWRDKPVAIMSSAAGRAGGERAQYSLRLCLTPFRPHLLTGPELCLAQGPDQFKGEVLINARAQKTLDELMVELRRAAGL
ncbi:MULTISPECIES: NADPH-dependent FMN reductase [unclassified Roseobacter]|uniref:NADPH-dependent FMN reductase n=1 Tax=unclassified Roseobacter TaxID=196798 RepID=UPI0030EC1FD3